MIVPVTGVSLLSSHAICEACSLSRDVVAVTVVVDGDPTNEGELASLQSAWDTWDPGVPLQVLHTDYASVVTPIVAFIDELRRTRDEQIVVLIPVAIPSRARYRILHNQIDLVLSAALHSRDDVVVARVGIALGTTGPALLPAIRPEHRSKASPRPRANKRRAKPRRRPTPPRARAKG